MSAKLYHINPNTGVPSRCYAKNGRCPYGGTSGMSNHYKTYTEAQAYAQEVMENEYRMLPTQIAEYEYELDEIDKLLEEKTNRNSDDIRNFLSMSIDSQAKEIRRTKNNDLLIGVINGEIGNGDWRVIGPALQNENVPNELLQEILFEYAGAFGDETQKWAVTNKSLSAEDLRRVMRGKNRNPEVKALALANDNIEKEYLDFRANKGTFEDNVSLPNAMIFYDERNKGKLPWVDENGESVRESESYKKTAIKAKELFDKYTKPNINA